MAISPLSASGLLKLLPFAPRLPDLGGLLGSLFGGPAATADRDPDFSGDDALVARIAVQDPAVRIALLREIDRLLSDDVPEDAETTARLERLRDLLQRLDVAGKGDVVPSVEASVAPEPPRPSNAPAAAVAPPPDVRFAAAKGGGGEPFRIAGGAASGTVGAPPVRPAAEAAGDAELVERILRASRLVQAKTVSRLRLVLDPPELGELRLDLTLRENVVHGAFQTDAAPAAELLAARLGELKEALERRGLRVGELTVSAPGAEPAAAAPANPFAEPASFPGNLDLKA